MHGAGNDYIYVDTTRYPIADPEKKAIEWSKFHTVNPYSYTYLPTQRLPLPHIIASEPSALNIRILKSAFGH